MADEIDTSVATREHQLPCSGSREPRNPIGQCRKGVGQSSVTV